MKKIIGMIIWAIGVWLFLAGLVFMSTPGMKYVDAILFTGSVVLPIILCGVGVNIWIGADLKNKQ